MKPKTIILMVVAVACGLAASYMTSRVIADRNHSAGPAEEEKVSILVASRKIPYGILIKDPHKYFAEKLYTKGEEPKKCIKSWEQVQDKRLNKALSEDQFVTAEDLLDPKAGGGVEILLPPGMRAVALKVNAASVVAGFVMPNSRVDVVLTLKNGERLDHPDDLAEHARAGLRQYDRPARGQAVQHGQHRDGRRQARRRREAAPGRGHRRIVAGPARLRGPGDRDAQGDPPRGPGAESRQGQRPRKATSPAAAGAP